MKVKISLVVVMVSLVAAACAFADGYNLVAWPLIVADNSAQAVFADSMGNGCQITGGYPAGVSDQIKFWDGTAWYTAWYKVGGPGGSYVWKGTLHAGEVAGDPQVLADDGYWIIIRSTHPAVTLTMTGSVNTVNRIITINPGLSYNFVGSAWATPRALSGSSGDDCNLIGSGFTGGYPAGASDQFKFFDGTSWYTAWYKVGGPGASNIWKGKLSATQTLDDPYLDPGNGYILIVQAGHAFIANTWTFPPPPPAKAAGTELSTKTRAMQKREVSKNLRRARGPSTNQRLVPEKEAEVKQDR